MGGGSKTQTTTQQASIPAEIKPYANYYLAQAQNLATTPYNPNGGGATYMPYQSTPTPAPVAAPVAPVSPMAPTSSKNLFQTLAQKNSKQKVTSAMLAPQQSAVAPAQTQPNLTDIPYVGYGGQRVADFDPDQVAGTDMIRAAAQRSAGDTDTARGQFSDTANGAYMGYQPGFNPMLGLNNPYLTQAIDYATGDVSRAYAQGTAPQTDARFARSGAFGGSAWQQAQTENNRAYAQELGRVSSTMRMDDYTKQQQLFENAIGRSDAAYQAERARQLSAAGSLPNLAANDINAGQALYNVGTQKRTAQQQKLDQAYQEWLDARNEPQRRLAIMQSAIGSILGGGIGGDRTTTAPNPNYVSPFQQAMGAVATVGSIVAAPATGGASLAALPVGTKLMGGGGGGGSSTWINPDTGRPM